MAKAQWHKYAPLVYDKKVSDHILHLKPGTLQYEDFWEEHAVECLGSNADPVECWENLIQKLGPIECDYHNGQRMGEPARTYLEGA